MWSARARWLIPAPDCAEAVTARTEAATARSETATTRTRAGALNLRMVVLLSFIVRRGFTAAPLPRLPRSARRGALRRERLRELPRPIPPRRRAEPSRRRAGTSSGHDARLSRPRLPAAHA